MKSGFQHTLKKLKSFVQKYYLNEMIKGGILFLSLGLLYFLITLGVEGNFWLDTQWRTLLFWTFIAVELLLLIRWILYPAAQLFGIRRGISDEKASRLIGKHFPEIGDKLLNLLQLKEEKAYSDLLVASIEQKSSEINPVPFSKAVDFKSNVPKLWFFAAPLTLFLLYWLTGTQNLLSGGLDRMVHHQTEYVRPAPFEFLLLNDSLETVEMSDIELRFALRGEVVPEELVLVDQQGRHYLSKNATGQYNYTVQSPREDLEFHLEGNGYKSQSWTLSVLKAPRIEDFEMILIFPRYLGMENLSEKSTGNARIPEGTKVEWRIKAPNAERLLFKKPLNAGNVDWNVEEFTRVEEPGTTFKREAIVRSDLSYQISSSNSKLSEYERLDYKLEVIKDLNPKITVRSDLDSLSRDELRFIGEVSDDHGLSKLQVVAKEMSTGKLSIKRLEIDRADFARFFYLFPQGLALEEGKAYELYFEVYDNDAVNGTKKSVSQSFFYNNRTQEEIQNEILETQSKDLKSMEDAKKSAEQLEQELKKFSKELQGKEKLEWNDEKRLKEYLDRQKTYQKQLEQRAEQMMENLEDTETEENSLLEEKKEALEKRWEEIDNFKEKEDLLEELEELANKLQREDLLDKLDKLEKQNRQEKRSLERLLELTKQFYVEKKAAKLAEDLDKLAEEQFELANDPKNNAELQNKLNESFDSLQNAFEDLRKENSELKNPKQLHNTEDDEKLVKMDMQEAKKSLERGEEQKNNNQESSKQSKEKGKQKQRQAGQRMKEMSAKMQQSMMGMEMQANQENIEDLQQVLKNLVLFSKDQEALMEDLKEMSDRNADFPEKLKEQVKLKEHFEHIDDSLYAISMRLVNLSKKMDEHLANAHYYTDRSLSQMADNRVNQARSSQQYTMTEANNLADLLSDMLNSMQNQKPGSGQGKQGEEISLPDLIKKQKQSQQKMKNSLEEKKGKGAKGQEEMSGEQFELYQQQKMMRDELQQLLDKYGEDGEQGKGVLDKMEELERLLLEKGVTQESLERMQQLEYDLLELENASLKKEKEIKRESKSATDIDNNQDVLENGLGDKDEKELEYLKREPLRMRPEYQEKVKLYFDQKLSEEIERE